MQHPTRSILRIVPLALAALPLLVEAAPAAEEPHAAVREDKWDVLYLGDQRIGYARSTTSDVTENGRKITRTTTETHKKADGSTVTTTKSSSFGISGQPVAPQLVSPARTEELFCELQITTGPDKSIRMLRATNDTDGEGFSLSRCAEVMGVKK